MTAPRYLTKVAFDRYAHDLGLALRAYPEVIRVKVPNSVETYAARFRDARKAKQLHGWTNPEVDDLLFEQHADSLAVAMRDGYVLIGTSQAIKAYETLATQPQDAPSQHDIEVSFSDYSCAVYLCELIRRRAFKTPIAFTVGPLSQELATKLEMEYGVTLVPVEGRDSIYTLL